MKSLESCMGPVGCLHGRCEHQMTSYISDVTPLLHEGFTAADMEIDGADSYRGEEALVHSQATERLEEMPPSTVTMVPLV